MAKFTRAEIRNILGDACTEEIENRLVALHLGVVDPLKDDLTKYKADAEKLPGVQKQLDDLKAAGDGGYKEKYEKEHSAFETYKSDVKAKESKAAPTQTRAGMRPVDLSKRIKAMPSAKRARTRKAKEAIPSGK